MKFLNNVFASIYLFFDAINNDRPGNIESPVFASIFILAILFTLNVLSIFFPETITGKNITYYSSVIISGCTLIMLFYVKKKYIRIVNQFKIKGNKELYYLISIAYIVISIIVFAMTR